MNKTLLIGRLTTDPEVKIINEKGTKITRFNLAVQRPFKNEKGEYDADFFPIIAFEKLAENLSQYSKKGDKVLIEGRLQNRSYTNQEGIVKYVTEIIASNVTFLEKVNKDNEA